MDLPQQRLHQELPYRIKKEKMLGGSLGYQNRVYVRNYLYKIISSKLPNLSGFQFEKSRNPWLLN